MVFLIKMFNADKLKFTFYWDFILNRELLWLGDSLIFLPLKITLVKE